MSGKNIWDKYQLMVYIFLVLFATILGLVGYILPEGTAQSVLINLCSELFAVALLFFLFEREKIKRSCEEIFIVLKDGCEEVWFPEPLRRSQFSRNEVLGVVGMIPMKEHGKRFAIKYTSDPEFLRDVNRISEGDTDGKIYIRCTKKELEQFDVPEAWRKTVA